MTKSSLLTYLRMTTANGQYTNPSRSHDLFTNSYHSELIKTLYNTACIPILIYPNLVPGE